MISCGNDQSVRAMLLGDYKNVREAEPMELMADHFIKRPIPEWAQDDLMGPYLRGIPTDFNIAVQGTRVGVSRETEYSVAEVTHYWKWGWGC